MEDILRIAHLAYLLPILNIYCYPEFALPAVLLVFTQIVILQLASSAHRH